MAACSILSAGFASVDAEFSWTSFTFEHVLTFNLQFLKLPWRAFLALGCTDRLLFLVIVCHFLFVKFFGKNVLLGWIVLHQVLMGGSDFRLRLQKHGMFVDKLLILVVIVFIINLRNLPLSLHPWLDWRWTAQASQRDWIIFHGSRVNPGLLSDDRGPAAVYLDELAPHFLFHRLVV